MTSSSPVAPVEFLRETTIATMSATTTTKVKINASDFQRAAKQTPSGHRVVCVNVECRWAHLQRLIHSRNVRKTLKTMVLRRMSRRPRTVTDTRFNVGSVEQHHHSQTHMNTQTDYQDNQLCHTGSSTHLASACLHTGRIHHPLPCTWSKPPG